MLTPAVLLKKCQSLLRSVWVSPPPALLKVTTAFAVENSADLEQIFKVFRGEIKYRNSIAK